MKKFCIDITNGLAGFIIWGGAIVLAASVFLIGPLAILLTGAWVVCTSVVFALWFAVAGIYEESQKQTEHLKSWCRSRRVNAASATVQEMPFAAPALRPFP